MIAISEAFPAFCLGFFLVMIESKLPGIQFAGISCDQALDPVSRPDNSQPESANLPSNLQSERDPSIRAL